MSLLAQVIQTECSSSDTSISGPRRKELHLRCHGDVSRGVDAAMPTQTEVQPFFALREMTCKADPTTYKFRRKTENNHLHDPRPFVLRLPCTLRDFPVVLPRQMQEREKKEKRTRAVAYLKRRGGLGVLPMYVLTHVES